MAIVLRLTEVLCGGLAQGRVMGQAQQQQGYGQRWTEPLEQCIQHMQTTRVQTLGAAASEGPGQSC